MGGGKETNAQRQAELRRRRKADGWRLLWIDPDRVATAERIGSGDARRGINLALDRMGRSGKYDDG